jgi:hypothetical protein
MGVHPKVVQELLGHSQMSMTLDIYSHVVPSMQRDAMSKLDNIFKQQPYGYWQTPLSYYLSHEWDFFAHIGIHL